MIVSIAKTYANFFIWFRNLQWDNIYGIIHDEYSKGSPALIKKKNPTHSLAYLIIFFNYDKFTKMPTCQCWEQVKPEKWKNSIEKSWAQTL